MNTDKNTALYEKMDAEQDKFRDWLKSQPPNEILHHAYEYAVREDILMAMEELDLPQSRAAALLASTGTTPPMPANRATWICTGRPAAPTSPARRPSRRRLPTTTGTTGWTETRCPR